jgi:predicted nucleotidyltransferase
MHNRVQIAQEFAKAIKSDYIIKIILFGSVARVMIQKNQILTF